MAFTDFIASLFGGGDSGGSSGLTMDPNVGGYPKPTGGTPPIVPTGDSGGAWWMPLLIGGGATLASKLLNMGTDSDIEKYQKMLGGGTKTALKTGNALIKRAGAGQLTDPQQATVDRMKAEQNAKWNQYLSNLGIPVSSSQVQASNLVDTQATELANKLINESFQQGISALGLGAQTSQALLQSAMAQRADLNKTIWEVAQEIGRVLNPQQPKPGAPPTGGYTTSVPSEWSGSSVYDISSPEGMGY